MSEPPNQAKAQPAAAPPAPPLPAQAAAQPAVLTDGLTAAEESTLADLAAKREAALAARPGQVQVRVEPPHSEMHFGGHVISNDWTSVPESALAPLTVAAADSGVTLTQKEV